MPDVIESARTGRARCRGCGEKIEKGVLRFGEEVPNPYGEEEQMATHWFHLPCAAERRAEKVAAALQTFQGEVPGRDQIEEAIAWAKRNPRLALVRKAERAPTGRARCRECRELIAQGSWRVVMEPEAEGTGGGMGMVAPYSVHAGCAARHVSSAGLFEKLRRTSPGLSREELQELQGSIAGQ